MGVLQKMRKDKRWIIIAIVAVGAFVLLSRAF